MNAILDSSPCGTTTNDEAETQPEKTADAEAQPENPIEAIQKLFDEMQPHRPVLYGILEQCRSRTPVLEVNERVHEQVGDHAVFDAPVLCSLLQQAGALEHVVPQPASAQDVDVQGTAYLRASDLGETYWITTAAGQEFLDARDPNAAARALSKEPDDHRPVYRELLKFTATAEGATQKKILEHLGGFQPYLDIADKVSSGHLIDHAQKCGAIEWRDGWTLTEDGQRALESDIW